MDSAFLLFTPGSRWFALAALTLSWSTGTAAPAIELPDGLELVVAAAPPLVSFPLMGGIDDRGRLFIGESAGQNLDREGLEKQLPNRVLMLEDVDGDGFYDRSTVFADKMAFPSGACWVDGSLYVASPPGIWKLTDTNGDSVADRRELIVGGFVGFNGNGSHVKGPYLHPTDGRLYWVNAGGAGGRELRILQKDGTLVREGRITGVWSANRDGTGIRWHSIGAFDNPVKVDFTPDGEIVGVVNVHNQQPRQDTLVHFLYGGVYERPNGTRSSVMADLPHTLEQMPIIHSFGHVAVSGFTRYRSGALNPAWRDNLFVTFYNTQKLVRVELTGSGATYKAMQHEFLKLHEPNAHFTDALEDGDGSLLVLDTGGWFTRCPAGLSEKKDLRGAVYRIRRKNTPPVADPHGTKIDWAAASAADLSKYAQDSRWVVREKAARLMATRRATPAAATAAVLLDAQRPHERMRACEVIAQAARIGADERGALLTMLAQPLEPVLEHAAMFAAIATRTFEFSDLGDARSPALIRRLLLILEQASPARRADDGLLRIAKDNFTAPDGALASAAIALAARHSRSIELCHADFMLQLKESLVRARTLQAIAALTAPTLGTTEAQSIITAMLEHGAADVRQAAWRILSQQTGGTRNDAWLPPIARSLDAAADSANAADLQLLIDAIGKLNTNRFDAALQRISGDGGRPLPIRLKALAALSRSGAALAAETFARLLDIAGNPESPSARLDAVRFLSRANLSKEQLRELAPLLATAGPIELVQLVRMGRRLDAELARHWARHLAQSPVIGSVEESVIRTSFRPLPVEDYEKILAPTVRAAAAGTDAQKRRLEALTAKAAQGRPDEGRKVYAGSSCIACHKAGDLGRAMGPDLSRIGQIRHARDILEGILLPSAAIAHAYETHVIETASGQSHTGMILRDSTDALTLLDLAGQETSIPHGQIVGRSTMPTSLMPAGLEQAFTEQQLLDLVAWLTSLK